MYDLSQHADDSDCFAGDTPCAKVSKGLTMMGKHHKNSQNNWILQDFVVIWAKPENATRILGPKDTTSSTHVFDIPVFGQPVACFAPSSLFVARSSVKVETLRKLGHKTCSTREFLFTSRPFFFLKNPTLIFNICNSPGENSSFVVERTHLGRTQTWSFPCGSCAVFNSYPGKKVDKMYIAILCSSCFWVKVVPSVFGVERNETSKFEVTRWSWGYVPWPKDTQSLSSCLACTRWDLCILSSLELLIALPELSKHFKRLSAAAMAARMAGVGQLTFLQLKSPWICGRYMYWHASIIIF